MRGGTQQEDQKPRYTKIRVPASPPRPPALPGKGKSPPAKDQDSTPQRNKSRSDSQQEMESPGTPAPSYLHARKTARPAPPPADPKRLALKGKPLPLSLPKGQEA